MSEGNHSIPAVVPTTTSRRNRLIQIGGGTATALLLAGVLFQVFRAEPARSESREAPADGAGRARIDASGGQELARVNGQPVYYDSVARECFERHGSEVLDNVVNQMIIQQECDRRGITISEAEVKQEVVDIAKKFNFPVETWYQMLQAERGVSPQKYHEDIIWPMIALKKLAGADVKVTEEDMQKAFARDYGPRVKARMILINGNVRQATQIWDMAQAKKDDANEFDRLAREFSADPNTRALGGVIPPIRKHGGNDTVEKVAFALKPGEISAVTEVGENRYVILRCEGQTEPIVTDPKQVWQELYAQLVEEKTQEAVARTFESIKTKAQVVDYYNGKSTGGSPFKGNGAAIRQTGAIESVTPPSVKTAAGAATATQ